MNIIMDIAFAVLILVMGIFAYKKGFLSSLLGLFNLVISFVASYFLSGWLSGWIYETFFHSNMVLSVTEKLEEAASKTAATVTEALPGYIVTAARGVGLNITSLAEQSAAKSTMHDAAEHIVNGAVRPVMVFLMRVILVIVLFVLISILLRFLIRLFKGVNRVPLLGAVNKAFGLVIGLIKGAAIVVVICMALKCVIIWSGGSFLIFDENTADQSMIYEFINRFNPIV